MAEGEINLPTLIKVKAHGGDVYYDLLDKKIKERIMNINRTYSSVLIMIK